MFLEVFLEGVQNLKQYFELPTKKSKYRLKYTLKAVHVLEILDVGHT